MAVEATRHTGKFETVYNFRVADFHTYFVGGEEWGFSVWAHNADCVGTAKGFILSVNRNAGWTAAQLAEAGRKLGTINKAALDGLVSVTRTIVRSGGQKAFRSANPAGVAQQADHIIDLQLGGKDILANLRYLDGSVNASLGASIKAAIANLADGDIIRKVILR